MPLLLVAGVVVVAVAVVIVLRRRRSPGSAALTEFARAATALEIVDGGDVDAVVEALRTAERARRTAMMSLGSAQRGSRVDTMRHFRAIERRRSAAAARAEASLPEGTDWADALGDDPFTLWAAAQAASAVDADAIMRRLEAEAQDEDGEA